MKRTILTIMLVLAYAAFGVSQSQSSIAGQVTDSEGAAIARARVLVHWDPSGSTVGLLDNVGIQQDVTVTTDITGRYSLNIPAGFYDVFVTAMAFTPAAAKVRVKPGKLATCTVKLRADPLVSKELAD